MNNIGKIVIFGVATLTFFLSGCATKSLDDKVGHENAQMLPKESSKDYAVYAMMASNAYLDKDRTYFNLDELGWVKVDRDGNPTNENSYSPSWIGKIFSNLQYDIWESQNSNKTVIAFKGTDEKIDWLTNFWIGPSIAYKSAKKHVKKYIEKNDDRSVVVVGHSLGGGKAISVSLWLGVDAYAFNSSPRVFDGWGDNSEDATRIAIYQEKEILSIIRSLWPKFSEVMNEEDIYQTNFDFNGVNRHRIDYLAEGILRCSDNDDQLKKFASTIETVKVTCNL